MSPLPLIDPASYGNENWQFDADGYTSRREAGIHGARPASERDAVLPLR